MRPLLSSVLVLLLLPATLLAAEGTRARADDAKPPAAKQEPRLKEVTLELSGASTQPVALPKGKVLQLPGELVGTAAGGNVWLVRRGRGIVSLDARKKELGKLDVAEPNLRSDVAGLIPGYVKQGEALVPAALRLSDGRVLIPEPRLPDGSARTPALLFVAKNTDVVMVLAEDKIGYLWSGRWDPSSGPQVSLEHLLAEQGNAGEWAGEAWDLVTVDEWGHIKPGVCGRLRLKPTGPRCVTVAPLERDAIQLGDWQVTSWSLCTSDAETCLQPQALGAKPVAALRSPVRVLFAWQADDSNIRELALFGSEGSLGRWSYPMEREEDRSFYGNANKPSRPVLPEEALAWKRQGRSTFWIDVERGVVFKTPPLDPLGAVGPVDRQLLAVARGTKEDTVVWLDLDAQTLRVVGTVPSCPGPYRAGLNKGAWRSLECTRQPVPKLHRFERQWSELVNTSDLRRFRTPAAILDIVDGDRVVLGEAKETMAEQETTRGKLRIVKLP